MGLTDISLNNSLAAAGIVRSPGSQTFYVGPKSVTQYQGIGASNGNSGTSPQEPFASLSTAISAATSGRGDVIVVLPGYTETVTSSLTISKDALTIIGCNTNRPSITVNGAIDLFNITGQGVTLANLNMAITTTDAATAFVNVAGKNARLYNLFMNPSADANINVVDVITLASNGDGCIIENVDIRNTSTAVNSFLSIEAAVANLTLKNCFFFGNIVTAGVIDGAAATQMYWENVTIGTIGTTIPAIVLDSNPTGLLRNCYFSGTHTTLASNVNYGNALRLFECRVLEETNASAQGVLLPAADVD